MNTAAELYAFMRALFPIHRSLTGNGVRTTLRMIQEKGVPLEIHEIPSGTEVFGWTVPPEWNVSSGRIIDLNTGEVYCDFADNMLHVMGYSEPVSIRTSLAVLEKHIHTLPDQPEAVPYVTQYYGDRTWGFCMKHSDFEQMGPGPYDVKIESTLDENGSLTLAGLVIEP